MMLLLHSVVLEAEGVEERGPDCELRQLTNLKVFGDAVLHVVSWKKSKSIDLNVSQNN